MRRLGVVSSRASGIRASCGIRRRWKRFDIRPMGITRAIERALPNEDQDAAQTRWSDARGRAASLQCAQPEPRTRSSRSMSRPCEYQSRPHQAFAPIRRIGGRTGWYFGNMLWRIRGLIDLMMGGVGMRRGRPDPETPFPGSTLDFWRVEVYEPDRRLRLFAEMKVPGRAWLEFRAEPEGASTVIRQIAEFEPRGLVRNFVLVSPEPDPRSDVPGNVAAHCRRGFSAGVPSGRAVLA